MTSCIICTNPREVKKSQNRNDEDNASSGDQNNFRLELTKIWPIFLKHLSLSPSVYEEILQYYIKIEQTPFCFQHQHEIEQLFNLNKQLEEINCRINKVTTNLSTSVILTSSSSIGKNTNNANQKVVENGIKRNLRTRCNDDKVVGESSSTTQDTSLTFSSIPDKQVQKGIRKLRRTITQCYIPSIQLNDCQKKLPKLLNQTNLPKEEENEKTVQKDSKISDLKNNDIDDKQMLNVVEISKCIQNQDITSCNQEDRKDEAVPSVSKSKDEEEEQEFENYSDADGDEDDDDPGFILTNIQLNINQNAVEFLSKEKNEGNVGNNVLSKKHDDYQKDIQKDLNYDMESPTSEASKVIDGDSVSGQAVPDTFDSVEENSFPCYIEGCDRSFKLKRGLMGHLVRGHKVKQVNESRIFKSTTTEDVSTKMNLNKSNDSFQNSSSCLNYDEKEVEPLSKNNSPNNNNNSTCTVTSTVPSVIVVNKNYKNPKVKENEEYQEDALLEIDPRVSVDSNGIFHYGLYKYKYLKEDNKMKCIKCGSNQSNHKEIIKHIDNLHGQRIRTFSSINNIDLEKLEECALLTDPSTNLPLSPLLNEEFFEEEEEDQIDDETVFEKQQEQQVSKRGRKKKQEFICEMDNCGKILHSHLALLMHQKVHGIQSIPCPAPECPKRFIKNSQLELHLHTTHPELSKAPNFSLQDINNSKNINLSSSLKQISPTSNNKININSKSTPSTTNTFNQKNIQSTTTTTTNSKIGVNGKQIWKCDDCPKEFQSYVGIYLHRKACHEEIDNNKYFSCPLCSQNFTLKVTLNHHLKTHSLVHLNKVFPCELCRLSFTSSASLSKHVARNHSVVGRVAGVGGRGRKKGSIHGNEHGIGIHHIKKNQTNNNNIRQKVFKCLETNCGKILASASSLSLHRRIHAGIRPFKCPVCLSSHVQKNHLKSHMDNHHPGVPMPKQKRFSFQNALISSTRTPTLIHNYNSPLPTRIGRGINHKFSWNTPSSTIKRFKMKPGPKPQKNISNSSSPIVHQTKQRRGRNQNVLWKCDFRDCNKGFSSYIALFSHKRSHSKTVIGCSERNCTMTFNQKSDYQFHLINHHKSQSASSSSKVMTSLINSNKNADFLNDEVVRLDMNEPDVGLENEEQDIFEIEYDYGDEDYDDDYSPSLFF